jgi:hypothetical protein
MNIIAPSVLNTNGDNCQVNTNKCCNTVSWRCSADGAVAVGHSGSDWSCVAEACELGRGGVLLIDKLTRKTSLCSPQKCRVQSCIAFVNEETSNLACSCTVFCLCVTPVLFFNTAICSKFYTFLTKLYVWNVFCLILLSDWPIDDGGN